MHHLYLVVRLMRNLFALVFAVFACMSSAFAQMLVAGTDFTPRADKLGEKFVSLDQVEQYGLLKGKLIDQASFYSGSGPFNAKFQYTIVQNPVQIDSSKFKDISRDYRLVVSPIGVQVPILTYTVSGLKPQSQATITLSYCSVVDTLKPDGASCKNSFSVFLVSDGGFNSKDFAAKASTCTTVVHTAVVNSVGELPISIQTYTQGVCGTIGISKIEVSGTPHFQIEPTSEEVCLGDFVLLKPKNVVEGSIKWQENATGAWTDIGTQSSINWQAKKVGTTKIRYTVVPKGTTSTIASEEYSVNAIACCTGPNGATTSRQTIYHDNFGRLDLTDPTGKTYYVWDFETNPRHPKEVKKTTTTPFRWPIVPAPIGFSFNGVGPVLDAGYTTAAYLTGMKSYNGIVGAGLAWANNIHGLKTPQDVAYDHSGKIDGGVLLLNPYGSANKVIYRKEFINICTNNGSNVFFECYITVFTNNSKGVDVTVRLINGNDTLKLQQQAYSVGFAPTGSVSGKWVRVSGQIAVAGNSSLTMEIVNNAPYTWDTNGNDLALDDIRLMTCAPPQAEVFLDKGLSVQADTVCNEEVLLSTAVSDNLKKFYNNTPQYLFQYSRTPQVYTSWKNVGVPTYQESARVPSSHVAFANATTGDNVYFRTIIATSDILSSNNFENAQNAASMEDPCRNYSITSPVVVTVNKSPDCDRVTGMEKSEGAAATLLYPNPTKELVQFGASVSSYRIHSVLGIVQAQGEASTISVATLPVGVYQVALTLHNGQVVWKQLLKE